MIMTSWHFLMKTPVSIVFRTSGSKNFIDVAKLSFCLLLCRCRRHDCPSSLGLGQKGGDWLLKLPKCNRAAFQSSPGGS